MVNNRSSGRNKTVPKSVRKTKGSADTWEDNGIETLYVDLAGVSSNKEEISLLFGHSPVHDPVQNVVSIESAERVCLNPFVAKRLALGLDLAIRDYEMRYGTIGEESIQPDFQLSSPSPDGTPFLLEKNNREAELLLDLTHKLNVIIGVERSFKLIRGTMLSNRFLLGFNKDDLGFRPHKKVLEICRQISMPENYLKTLLENLDEANIVLFGFEENEENSYYKAYLEFGGRFEETYREKPGRSGRFILHQGFKWDSIDNTRRAFANYTCFPMYSLEDMRRG